jgi:DNA polymerase-1
LIKTAMIQVHRRLGKEGLQAKMILQVHDELIFETSPEEAKALEALVKEEMQNVWPLQVPLAVDTQLGKNWLDAH